MDKYIEVLADETASIAARIDAAFILGQIRNPRAVKILVQAAKKDPHPRVRREAVFALGQIRDPNAIKPLIEVLENDPIKEVRCWAALSLWEFDPEHKHSFILTNAQMDLDYNSVQFLPAILFASENANHRAQAAHALGRRIQPGGLEALKHALMHDESSDVRSACARSLGLLADPASVDYLTMKLNNYWCLRTDSVYHNHNVRPVESEWNVLNEVAIALGRIVSPKAREPLSNLLKSRERIEVRSSAAESLGLIGEIEAAADLLEALSGQHLSIRWAACGALGKLVVKLQDLELVKHWVELFHDVATASAKQEDERLERYRQQVFEALEAGANHLCVLETEAVPCRNFLDQVES
ncbi:MAG: HEAT repeat domain-containing protein [Desulfomonilaceae bacterium]